MSSSEPARTHTSSSHPNKRLSTDSSDLERPIKRLHVSNAGQSGSSLGMPGLDPISTDSEMIVGPSAHDETRATDHGSSRPKGKGRVADEIMDIDGEDLIPPPKKWKGKGKMKVCPLLPDDIWRRVFDFLFDSYRQDWHQEVPVSNTLDSLLICKDLGAIAKSILYAHPHIHYDAIPRFLQSFSRSGSEARDARLSHTRDVTIRPSPTYFALSTGERSTLHPRLGELLELLPNQLNSLTLRETLITDNDDKDNLFAALKLVKPRKARLEIRFWDLSQSPIGRDLLAATRPGPYFTTSASFRRPANGEGEDAQGPRQAAMPPVVIIPPMQAPELKWFQELWRTAMITREELEIPMRWLEDEREVQAQAQAAQAAQQAAHAQNQAQLQALQGQLGGLPAMMTLHNPNNPNAGTGPPHLLGGGAIGSASLGASGAPAFQSASSVLGMGTGSAAWRNSMTARNAQLRTRMGSLSSTVAGSSAQVARRTATATATDTTTTGTEEGSSNQVDATPTESTGEAAASHTTGRVAESNVPHTTRNPDAPAEAAAAETASLGAAQSEDQATSRYNLRPRETPTESSTNTAPTTDSTIPTPTQAQNAGAQEEIGYPVRAEDQDRVTDTRAWLERFSKRVSEDKGSGDQPGFKWIPKEQVKETKPESWFISPKPEGEQVESGPALPTEQAKVEQPLVEVSPAAAPAHDPIKDETQGQAQDVEMKNESLAAGQLDETSRAQGDDDQSNQTEPAIETAPAPNDRVTVPPNPSVSEDQSAAAQSSENPPQTIDETSATTTIPSLPVIGTGAEPARIDTMDPDHAGDTLAGTPPARSPIPDSPSIPSEDTDVEDEDMQEALYRSRVDNFAGFANPPPQASQNTNLLSFASASGSAPTVPPPNNNNLRYIRRIGSAGSSTAVVNLNHPNNIITGNPPPVRFASAYLPHTFREALFQLFDQHWCPNLQAFSFVALDPHASVIAQAPRLDFWNRVAVSRIRVHLPRCINSLAVFKGLKENRRDRRKRQRDRLVAIAPPGQANDTESQSDDHIIVGGDGSGGDLVHETNRLFEIEVNTTDEMDDVVWIQGGDQLPPQVCRILAGSHDWNDVPIDFHEPSPWRFNEPMPYTPSPATSQFASPTFSWASGSCDEVMSEFDLDIRPDAGANYDAEAAKAQLHKQKSKLAQVEGADDEMEERDGDQWVDED